jgi:hypothetical protein
MAIAVLGIGRSGFKIQPRSSVRTRQIASRYATPSESFCRAEVPDHLAQISLTRSAICEKDPDVVPARPDLQRQDRKGNFLRRFPCTKHLGTVTFHPSSRCRRQRAFKPRKLLHGIGPNRLLGAAGTSTSLCPPNSDRPAHSTAIQEDIAGWSAAAHRWLAVFLPLIQRS